MAAGSGARLFRLQGRNVRNSCRTTSFSPDQISSTARTLMSTSPIGSATFRITSPAMSVGTFDAFSGQDIQMKPSRAMVFRSPACRRYHFRPVGREDMGGNGLLHLMIDPENIRQLLDGRPNTIGQPRLPDTHPFLEAGLLCQRRSEIAGHYALRGSAGQSDRGRRSQSTCQTRLPPSRVSQSCPTYGARPEGGLATGQSPPTLSNTRFCISACPEPVMARSGPSPKPPRRRASRRRLS